MFFSNTMRMIVDLSFYFFFAEFIVVLAGGTSMLLSMILLALSYGLLSYLQKNRKKRFWTFLPMIGLVIHMVLGASIANIIVFLPAMGYVIYLLWKEEEVLVWGRQVDIFNISWKVFLGMSICVCCAGQYELLVETSLPIALISLMSSVFFMRILRHSAEVVLDKQFLMKNMLLFVAIAMGVWAISQRYMLLALGSLISSIYSQIIIPIVMVFVTVFIAIIKVLYNLVSWIKIGAFPMEQQGQFQSGAVNPFADLEGELLNDSAAFEKFWIVLVVILLIILAILLFYRMANHWSGNLVAQPGDVYEREAIGKEGKEKYSFTSVHQVRRQYQKFLKLYCEKGGKLRPSDTSNDVVNKGKKQFDSTESLEEMREIYIRARYDNRSNRADVKRIKQIVQNVKNKTIL